eukprot:TRINITY_DN160_c0_g3_i1.p1 TRINITY_DN160_c0_g3~~TRINITY_DN160_c0_g3_i1.p1  ORF type:complete len:236 (+),score=43.54 TRINITY_DN160_c0_g3_i1:42-710(+)
MKFSYIFLQSLSENFLFTRVVDEVIVFLDNTIDYMRVLNNVKEFVLPDIPSQVPLCRLRTALLEWSDILHDEGCEEAPEVAASAILQVASAPRYMLQEWIHDSEDNWNKFFYKLISYEIRLVLQGKALLVPLFQEGEDLEYSFSGQQQSEDMTENKEKEETSTTPLDQTIYGEQRKRKFPCLSTHSPRLKRTKTSNLEIDIASEITAAESFERSLLGSTEQW